MRRPRPLTVVLAVLAPVLLVGGIWLGGHPQQLPGFARDLLADDATVVVAEALDLVEDDYVRRMSREDLADAAIKGMVGSLGDQFSSYFTAEEYARYQEVTESRFSGVGLSVVGVDEGLRVTRVYDGSPAKRAGIKPGDLITAVDGKPLRGVPEESAVARVKGPAGSRVRLTVKRDDKPFERVVTRATVSIPVVESRMVRDDGTKVGYVALASFSSGAHGEVGAAVRKLRQDGAKGLVLDLRGNPGGLVREAQLVASAFVPDGTIVSTKGRAVQPQTLKATGDPVAGDLPMVVLVDRGTASSAEIVTGALKDTDRAEVVGTRTFGKGVFQEVVPLSNGGALDITVGQYFTPNGTNLGKGLKPGQGVRPEIEAEDDPDTQVDEALRTGLKALAPGAAVVKWPGARRRPPREAGPVPRRGVALRARAADRGRPRLARAGGGPRRRAHARPGPRAREDRPPPRAAGRRGRRARGAHARPRAQAALRPLRRAGGPARAGRPAARLARTAAATSASSRRSRSTRSRRRTSTTRSAPRPATTGRSASGCTSPT